MTTTVDNNDNVIGDYGGGNKFFCEDTEDKIFLLSKGEVKMYDNFNENGERVKTVTEYAKAQGAFANASNGAWWWLRTPSYSSSKPNKSNLAQVVKTSGTYDSYVVDTITGGVVPAMWINI